MYKRQYDTSDLLDWFVHNGQAWVRGDAAYKINWEDPDQLLALKKHVCENKKELNPNDEFLFVNCLKYGDPDHDKSTRDHRGTLPETLEGIVKKFSIPDREATIDHILNWRENRAQIKDLVIVFVCKKEVHRSIGEWYLFARFFAENFEDLPISEEGGRMTPEIDVITPKGTGVYTDKCKSWCDQCANKTQEAKLRAEAAYQQYKILMSGAIKNIIDARMMGISRIPGLSDTQRAKGCMIAAEQHPQAHVIRSPVIADSIEDREPTQDEQARMTDQDAQMGMFVHTVPMEQEAATHMRAYHGAKFSQIPAVIENFIPEQEVSAPEVDPTAAAAVDEEDEDSEPEPLPPEPTEDNSDEAWRIYESRMAGRLRHGCLEETKSIVDETPQSHDRHCQPA